MPSEDADARGILYAILALGFVFVFLISPIAWIYRGSFSSWLGNTEIAPWLVLVPLTAATISISIALQSYVQRNRKYKHSGLAEVVGKGAYSGTALVGSFLGNGPGGLVIALFANALGKILALYRKIGGVSATPIQSLRVLSKYSSTSLSLTGSQILMTSTTAIPVFFISREYGATVLGQYALALQALYVPSALLGTAIGSVYYQRVSERWANGKSFQDIWASTAKKLLFVGIPVYGIGALILPWAFPILFGNEWQLAGRYGVLLAISSFFSFITVPMGRSCFVVGAWWYSLLWHSARTLGTCAVVYLGWHYSWEIMPFLKILTAQQAALYLIDYWAEFRFSRFQPGIA